MLVFTYVTAIPCFKMIARNRLQKWMFLSKEVTKMMTFPTFVDPPFTITMLRIRATSDSGNIGSIKQFLDYLCLRLSKMEGIGSMSSRKILPVLSRTRQKVVTILALYGN